MQKRFIYLGKRFSKASFMLFFLSLLILLIVLATPIAKAQTQSITLSPSQGPAGTEVIATVNGFPTLYSVNINFGTESVGTAVPVAFGSTIGVGSNEFQVPPMPTGTYTVTATGVTGTATTTFEITPGSAATPTPAPNTSTVTPSGSTGSTG